MSYSCTSLTNDVLDFTTLLFYIRLKYIVILLRNKIPFNKHYLLCKHCVLNNLSVKPTSPRFLQLLFVDPIILTL